MLDRIALADMPEMALITSLSAHLGRMSILMLQYIDCEWNCSRVLMRRCRYEGTWSKGLRNGQGKCKYTNGDLYDGTWSNDMRAGSGTCAYANDDKYTGVKL